MPDQGSLEIAVEQLTNEILSERLQRVEQEFVVSTKRTMEVIHALAVSKGWWEDGDRNFGELIALIHSEASEALEAWRHGNPQSDKIPAFDGITEELADIIIRIFDTADRYEMPLAEAIVAKTKFNMTRSYRHGGKKA